jgi:hypothetical protein
MKKSLDEKLARIHADPRGAKDFILADAKDADMALGLGATGRSPEAHNGEVRYRSLQKYRDQIEQIVEQGLVDIMLMSAHTNEILTIQKRIFDQTHVTPAAPQPGAGGAAIPHGDTRSHPVRAPRLRDE